MRDPIIEEMRKLREEYAAQFNHDSNAIFDDIIKRQSRGGKKLVTFPARKPNPSVKRPMPSQRMADQVSEGDQEY